MTSPVSVVSLDDGQLMQHISEAHRTLSCFSPGISLRVAKALAQKWEELGPDAMSVVLDVDPEVCRVGFGTVEAVELLQKAAEGLGATLRHRPGLRIGLLITENTTVVFAPMPLLIEAESTDFPRPNAVCLKAVATEGSSETHGHIEREAEDLKQGSEPVNPTKMEEVSKDLASNPPQKFNLARVVQVFNALFQFVEFKLSGFLITRMSVPIPPDLTGLAKDEELQKLWHSTFRLVRSDCEVSGEKILQTKNKILKDHLVTLKGFGDVCLRANKESFLNEIQKLRSEIEEFHKEIAGKLQKEMDTNRHRLVDALLPAVAANPPSRWKSFLGPTPSTSDLREPLNDELAAFFPSAEELIKKMKVKVIFKDVTYESLTDPKFLQIARKALHNPKVLHEEYLAAKGEPRAEQESKGASCAGSKRI